jgi:hypothetical protein
MGPKIDVMERECKNYNILSASKQSVNMPRTGRAGADVETGRLWDQRTSHTHVPTSVRNIYFEKVFAGQMT